MSDEAVLRTETFAASEPGPKLLITGGVHGDEFEPIAAIWRLIAQLGGDEPEARLTAGTATFVPTVNEAAFRNGARTAEDGLDLARVCPGKADGSVTERTAHALSRLILASDYYIDLHSGGIAFSVMPMTGYTLHADVRIADKQREMARAFNLPIVWGTAPTLDGRSLSVARDAGVPAIYAEYHGSGLCDPRGVDAYVDGCLNVMRWLRMMPGEFDRCCVELTVEDPRPDSGHMQVCNPSPVNGFFEPSVELGQQVQSGDLLGAVIDPTDRARHELRAQETGVVLVLRTFSRVMAGESVGVVLATKPDGARAAL